MKTYGFSLKLFFGLTELRRKFSIKIGVPTTKNGMQRKLGSLFFRL